ncbi:MULTISPECIES: phage protein Gp36 family protein [Helicobacter]|uniref:phage protein Gp36 family protein n=1 Tax=Helicobacter TaxID=209 RepID=UPI000A5B20A6|nr:MULTISPECIES: phage protein Gp36 family protein [Helicobacter]
MEEKEELKQTLKEAAQTNTDLQEDKNLKNNQEEEQQEFLEDEDSYPPKKIGLSFKKPIITESELIDELGVNEIRDLSDIHGEGVWNRCVIDDCIKDAENLIASFFKLPSNPTPFLKDICTKLTIVELKRRNSYPKEELDSIKAEALEWLGKMAKGKIPTSLEDNSYPKNRCFIHKQHKLDLKRLYD